jgi:hypothetical protein
MSKQNKKLMLGSRELEKGDVLDYSDVGYNNDAGVIVGINFEEEEVYMYDGKEGWTCSEENENLGNMKFVNV